MRRAIVAIVLLAACSGKAAPPPERTATSERSTTPLAPEEAFKADLVAGLDGVSAEQLDPLVDFAREQCALLDTGVETAGGDAEVLAPFVGFPWGPEGLSTRGFEPDAIDVVVTAAAEHFCPEHTVVVEAYIAGH